MRVAILGATGAMGGHLVRLLAEAGHDVTATSRRRRTSPWPCVNYVQGNAHDPSFLLPLLSNGNFDVVVDFMVWPSSDFARIITDVLSSTDQYVFVSSYRVYDDAPLLTEDSPRLLDTCNDSTYLETDEYALAKARCEDMLFASARKNWTIVRPSITYDRSGRFQLGVLEGGTWLWRAQRGYSSVIPDELLGKQATLTAGYDAARLLFYLLGNPRALGEAFNLSTSEHVSWRNVIEAYHSVLPFRIVPCSVSSYVYVSRAPYQVKYDRLFNRIVDNTKILQTTGIKQGELASVETGLVGELSLCLAGRSVPTPPCGTNSRLDALLDECCLLELTHGANWLSVMARYLVGRFR